MIKFYFISYSYVRMWLLFPWFLYECNVQLKMTVDWICLLREDQRVFAQNRPYPVHGSLFNGSISWLVSQSVTQVIVTEPLNINRNSEQKYIYIAYKTSYTHRHIGMDYITKMKCCLTNRNVTIQLQCNIYHLPLHLRSTFTSCSIKGMNTEYYSERDLSFGNGSILKILIILNFI